MSAAENTERAAPTLSQAEIDEIFDAHRDAPTMSFRYYVTDAIAKKLEQKRAAAQPQSEPATRDDGMPASKTERELRRMLCAAYAGTSAYMDDGEASDCRAQPAIDFMRMEPAAIREAMYQRGLAQLAAERAAQQPKPPFDREALLDLFDAYADATREGYFDHEAAHVAAQIVAAFECAAERRQLTDREVGEVLSARAAPPTNDGQALHAWAVDLVRDLRELVLTKRERG